MALLEASSTYQILDTDHATVGAWMHDHGAGPYRVGATCIGLMRHGELVAGTMYDFCNGASILASIAIAGPINRQWLWYIFAYPFLQLNVKVILGLISSQNAKSLRLTERMGFKLIASIPGADPSGSLHIYALHRDECRFIRSPYAKAVAASRT